MRREVTIGTLRLKSNLLLAPMAGVTDLPFRLLCEEQGIGLACTEMVSAKAILYGNRNTEELLRRASGEEPLAVQLFGSEPELMGEIAAQLEERFSLIDVNMGCPVPKIVRNGEGSALMQEPARAYEILRRMVRRCRKPVTVKFRAGFDAAHRNAAEFARMAENAGVSAITVHGRTREQFYHGKADWNILREVKQAVHIPVFGNGDVFCPEDAKRMLEETGVDGIALARGVKGNPWLIGRTLHYLDTGELLPEPTLPEKLSVIRRHIALMVEYKGEHTAVLEMRKHLSWYTVGMPNSSILRDRVNHAASTEELYALCSLLEGASQEDKRGRAPSMD